MGYQQSFISYASTEELVKDLQEYGKRDRSKDQSGVYCINRVKKELPGFKEGELVVVVGGERYDQRGLSRLKEGLGLSRASDIVFIENVYPAFELGASVELSNFLDDHFESLTNEEHDELLG